MVYPSVSVFSELLRMSKAELEFTGQGRIKLPLWWWRRPKLCSYVLPAFNRYMPNVALRQQFAVCSSSRHLGATEDVPLQTGAKTNVNSYTARSCCCFFSEYTAQSCSPHIYPSLLATVRSIFASTIFLLISLHMRLHSLSSTFGRLLEFSRRPKRIAWVHASCHKSADGGGGRGSRALMPT